MAASLPKLVKSFALPVDPAVFSGVPSVTALKPLPKANALLAAGMDRRVVCCELSAETKQGSIKGKHLSWAHDNWIHDLDVHPDGERIATGGTDRHIKLWKWGEEKPLAAFKAHDEWVRVVAFSPKGNLLASAGDDCRVKLWDVASAKLVATLDPRGNYLDSLAWTPDGKQLYSGGHDGKVFLWDIERKTSVRVNDFDNRRDIEDEPLNGGFSYPGGVRGMTVSADGTLLALVGLKSLHVVETATNKEKLRIDGRGFGVAFDPAGTQLAFSQEQNIAIYDFKANAVGKRITVNQLGIFDLHFAENGKQLIAGGCNGVIGIWDLSA